MSDTAAADAARMPGIAADQRGIGIGKVAAIALVHAAGAGVAAFATRAVFGALHSPESAAPMIPILLLVVAGFVIALACIVQRTVAEGIGQDYAAAVRQRLFSHLAYSPASAIASRRDGALALRFVGDLSALRRWVSKGIAQLVCCAIVVPSTVLVMAMIEPLLALAAAVPLALCILTMALLSRRLAAAHRLLLRRRSRLASSMFERIPHAPELRLLGRLSTEKAQLTQHADELRAAACDRARLAATLRALPDIASGIAVASVLFIAFRNSASAADAAATLAALGIAVMSTRSLASIWDLQRAWRVAHDRCLVALQRPTLPQRCAQPPFDTSAPAVRVRFLAVQSHILRCVDGWVAEGQKVAVIGANGAGKSSLLGLAAGLELTTQGKVTIADRIPSDLTPTERGATIAHIGARSPMLAGSLRRALTLGCAHRPDDQAIRHAAERCGLAPVLLRLGGLDGRIAENARNLSSGEARRVLLTRLALSSALLWLLDEPDEGLDDDGVALLLQLVRETPATVLIATHSRTLARHMDQAWLLRGGRLAMAGAPDEILQARHWLQPQSIA